MSKSLYSLILNDEVVQKIDKMARINGMSRSNMIEKLLADAVGYETPQMRAGNIFEEIEKLLATSGSMRYLANQSQYMASIISALDYRYNPAIKYSVELFPNSKHLGQLKVTLRTQNSILIDLLSDFFNIYAYLEKAHYNSGAVHLFESNRFTRLFDFPKTAITTKELAEKLTLYVKHFDELLNLYFNNLDSKNLLSIIEQRFIVLKMNEIVI
ncbi:MAG: ribbon-helix-helix protein, CopG family [Clostridia bacterium]|nr:ribbon-helix-helix protein, CopG family [Clostridia bacterium]